MIVKNDLDGSLVGRNHINTLNNEFIPSLKLFSLLPYEQMVLDAADTARILHDQSRADC